jgi:hypothetical protein
MRLVRANGRLSVIVLSERMQSVALHEVSVEGALVEDQYEACIEPTCDL